MNGEGIKIHVGQLATQISSGPTRRLSVATAICFAYYRTLLWEVRRHFLPDSAVSEPAIWHGEHQHFLTDQHVRQ